MKVSVEYPAPLHLPGTPSGSEVDLPPGATVADLLRALRVEPLHQAHIACFINEERARPARVLADGDRVYLQVPISGG
jgi:sulfur carrier protein ThiS